MSAEAGVEAEKDASFGASHTSIYTSAVAKDSYATIEDILSTKMADAGVREVVTEMLAACVKITEALRVNLVTVADAQNSVFGDVQLGVDVIADRLMWEACKSSNVYPRAPLHTCRFLTRPCSRTFTSPHNSTPPIVWEMQMSTRGGTARLISQNVFSDAF